MTLKLEAIGFATKSHWLILLIFLGAAYLMPFSFKLETLKALMSHRNITLFFFFLAEREIQGCWQRMEQKK